MKTQGEKVGSLERYKPSGLPHCLQDLVGLSPTLAWGGSERVLYSNILLHCLSTISFSSSGSWKNVFRRALLRGLRSEHFGGFTDLIIKQDRQIDK